ncbi:hypothetical protein HZS_3534 [Henneguya salminicola]|nr:hypothetical protein HZS_3534 [Henneguya salminicola]
MNSTIDSTRKNMTYRWLEGSLFPYSKKLADIDETDILNLLSVNFYNQSYSLKIDEIEDGKDILKKLYNVMALAPQSENLILIFIHFD